MTLKRDGIRTLEERLVYENAWIRVYDDVVEFPNGSTGTYYRSRWKAPHGVAIVAVSGDAVLLMRSFRYGAGWTTEIPQGFGVEGASPEDDARRELHEETGLEAASIRPLLSLGLDYVTHVFVAELSLDASPDPAGAETSESIGGFLRLASKDISPQRLMDLGVVDPLSVAALLAYQQGLSE